MLVRPYTEADLDTFKRIHAESKLNYRVPDLSSPLFIVKQVVEREGKPTTLLAGRLTVEAYLMTEGSAAERLGSRAYFGIRIGISGFRLYLFTARGFT